MKTSPTELRRVSSRVLPSFSSSSSTTLDGCEDDGRCDEIGAEAVLLDDRSRSSASSSGVGRLPHVAGATLTRTGGYALRKFLSTPLQNNNNRGNNNIDTRRDDDDADGGPGGGAHSASRLRRTPSHDPALDGAARFFQPTYPSSSSSLFHNLLLVDDDDDLDDDDGGGGGGRGEGGRGVEASVSPLFFRRDDDDDDAGAARTTSLTATSTSRARSSSVSSSTTMNMPPLSSPMPLKRTAISLRRKKSELARKGISDPDDDDDDLSTVVESVDPSMNDDDDERQMMYDDNEKRKGHPSRRQRRRQVVAFCSVFLLASCAAGAVMVYVSVGNKGGGVGGGGGYRMSSNHLELALPEGGMGESNDLQLPNDLGGGGGDDAPTTTTTASSYSPTSYPVTTTAPPADADADAPPSQGGSDAVDAVVVAATTTIATPPAEIDAMTSTTTTTTTATTTTTPQVVEEEGTVTIFYLMADCPYSTEEREYLMPAHIDQLGSDAEFLVHLGDLQYAQEDHCEEWAYEIGSDILKKSRVPTFVLPGDNDMNDCEDHEHGEAMWSKYFKRIDERWDHDFELTRWGSLDESFSFVRKGVLYFGVHVPGGTPYSVSEADERYEEHLEKINSILDGLDNDDYQVIVLLGHADPSYDAAPSALDFFEGFADIVREIGKPTVHFHGDWHEYYEVEGGDYDLDNYVRISLDGESIAPPIRVEIDVSKENPIKVSRVKSGLAVDCCGDGWPSHEEL